MLNCVMTKQCNMWWVVAGPILKIFICPNLHSRGEPSLVLRGAKIPLGRSSWSYFLPSPPLLTLHYTLCTQWHNCVYVRTTLIVWLIGNFKKCAPFYNLSLQLICFLTKRVDQFLSWKGWSLTRSEHNKAGELDLFWLEEAGFLWEPQTRFPRWWEIN